MQLLHGHISPETAYEVADYPYGFRLRCRIRYFHAMLVRTASRKES